MGQKEKAYAYLVKSIEPIDKKFNAFVKIFSRWVKKSNERI
jgi:hypothetical protein